METQDLTDELTQLALRARTDRDALDELIACEVEYVTWWVRKNVNYCYRDDYDDIVQEILMAIAFGIPGFKGKSTFARWSGKIMYNRLCTWFRGKNSLKRSMEDLYPDMEIYGGTYEMASRIEFDELLSMVVPSHREVLELRYVDGYGIGDIFAMQDECDTYEALRSRMRRDRALIKSKLERRAK
jgi:RNA polymerase sigma factor (sigma-70 family)